MKQITLLLL